jgi:hypothetical protein
MVCFKMISQIKRLVDVKQCQMKMNQHVSEKNMSICFSLKYAYYCDFESQKHHINKVIVGNALY